MTGQFPDPAVKRRSTHDQVDDRETRSCCRSLWTRCVISAIRSPRSLPIPSSRPSTLPPYVSVDYVAACQPSSIRPTPIEEGAPLLYDHVTNNISVVEQTVVGDADSAIAVRHTRSSKPSKRLASIRCRWKAGPFWRRRSDHPGSHLLDLHAGAALEPQFDRGSARVEPDAGAVHCARSRRRFRLQDRRVSGGFRCLPRSR